MLKKLVSAIIAGAFASALAAPAVMACPGQEEVTVAKKSQKDNTKTAQKAKGKKNAKPDGGSNKTKSKDTTTKSKS